MAYSTEEDTTQAEIRRIEEILDDLSSTNDVIQQAVRRRQMLIEEFSASMSRVQGYAHAQIGGFQEFLDSTGDSGPRPHPPTDRF